MDEQTPEKKIGVLEYHAPVPRQWPGIIRTLISAGPWWIVPSWKSLAMLLPLAVCIAGLRLQPAAWKPGRMRTLAPIYSASVYGLGFKPCAPKDAVFCVDGNGDPILWRPWDNQVLTRYQRPGPLTRHQRPGNVVWLVGSGDSSKLIAEVGNAGVLLWDSGTGMVLHQLMYGPSPYLPHEAVYDVVNLALSNGGNLLAITAYGPKHQLMLWDISGARARELAAIPWNIPAYGSLVFSPDDTLLEGSNYHGLHVYSVPTLAEAGPNVANRGFTSQYAAVSPDGRRAVGPGLKCACLAGTGQAGVGALPSAGVWPSGVACFFPDNRRVAINAENSSEVDVVDVVENVQLAVVPLPGGAGMGAEPVSILVSADGRHIAVAFGNGQVRTFDQSGPGSRWGVLASPWFGLTAVVLMLVALSLWRDACGRSPETKGHLAAVLLVTTGTIAALVLCALPVIHVSAPSRANQIFGWAILALWLPAGLCIRAQSGGWTILAGLVIAFSACIGFAIGVQSRAGTQMVLHILDRTWIFSTWTVMYASLAFCLFSAAVFILLLIEWRQSRLRKLPA